MQNRIPLSKIKQILRCLFGLNLSKQETEQRLQLSRDTVRKYGKRFLESGLNYPLDVDDAVLSAVFAPAKSTAKKVNLDLASIHRELQLHKKLTLSVLHAEWETSLSADEGRLSYSQFVRRYDTYRQTLRLSLRHQHVPGQCVFVDYSGSKVDIVSPDTGEVYQAEIFVGVLGYSGYTYCEASRSQSSQDWNASLMRMFAFFGGVPEVIVPDNLKAAVINARPDSFALNVNFEKLCEHYGIHPAPARIRKPKDKAKAEAAVLLCQRWILQRLRKQQFFSLEEVNRAIVPLLDALNAKPFQKLPGSRQIRYMETERATLKPLPSQAYDNSYWGVVHVGSDYHAEVEGAAYSIPYELRNRRIEYCSGTESVKFYADGRCIAAHLKAAKGGCMTHPDHQPPEHKAVAQVTPEFILRFADRYGADCRLFFEYLLDAHRQQYTRLHFFKGFKKLADGKHPNDIADLCRYALKHRITNITQLKQALPNIHVIRQHLNGENTPAASVFQTHRNLRGSGYYQTVGSEQTTGETQ